MAKLRPAKCHRRLKRAYTRTSKYRRKSYIKAAPDHKIIHFDSGNKRYELFDTSVILYAGANINLRHNAIEAARITTNRHMIKAIGKGQFGLKLRVFPHQIIRENPIAMGAGADRMSQGMRASFGKSVSRSARIKEGQAIMQLFVPEASIKDAKNALKKATSKFPIACKSIAEKNKVYDPSLEFVYSPRVEEEIETPETEEDTTEEDTTEESTEKEIKESPETKTE